MTIKASADKLAREIEEYGNPHWFPLEEDTTEDVEACKPKMGAQLLQISSNEIMRSFADLRKLKGTGKIAKDVRYTMYSSLDGQPCADHDRTSGEGVQTRDYLLIIMEVIPPSLSKLKVLEGQNLFLAATTLWPEIMYGQTNCWVLPEGKYGAFEVNETDVFFLTWRFALNLAYHKLRVSEKPTCLVEVSDLIGLPLKSPLTMLTILTDKGTGIVTSVPSDSPDDYIALKDLKSKKALRSKFGVKDEVVLNF